MNKPTTSNLNAVFKELYNDKLKDLIPNGTPLWDIKCPNEFRKKYTWKQWCGLNGGEQNFIIKNGLKAWEKKNQYKDEFENLLK